LLVKTCWTIAVPEIVFVVILGGETAVVADNILLAAETKYPLEAFAVIVTLYAVPPDSPVISVSLT
jgi:hypothetical protein